MPRAHRETYHGPRDLLTSPYALAAFPWLLPLTLEDALQASPRHRAHKTSNDSLSPAQAVINQLLARHVPVVINLSTPCPGCACDTHRRVRRQYRAERVSSRESDADDEISPRMLASAKAELRQTRRQSPAPVPRSFVFYPPASYASSESSCASDETARPQHVSRSILAEPSPLNLTFMPTAGHMRKHERRARSKRKFGEAERAIEGMSEVDIERWRRASALSSAFGSIPGPPPYEPRRGSGEWPQQAQPSPSIPEPLQSATTVYMDVCHTANQTVYMDMATPRAFDTGVLAPPPSSGWPQPQSEPQSAPEVPMLSRRTTSQPAFTPREGTPMDWEAGNETEPLLAVAATELPCAPERAKQQRRRRRRKLLQAAFGAIDSVDVMPAIAVPPPPAIILRASAPSISQTSSDMQTTHASSTKTSLKRPLPGTPDIERASKVVHRSKAKAETQTFKPAVSPIIPRPSPSPHSSPADWMPAPPRPNPKRKRDPVSPSPSRPQAQAQAQARPVRALPQGDLLAFEAACRAGAAADGDGEAERERLRLAELEFERLFAHGFSLDLGLEFGLGAQVEGVGGHGVGVGASNRVEALAKEETAAADNLQFEAGAEAKSRAGAEGFKIAKISV